MYERVVVGVGLALGLVLWPATGEARRVEVWSYDDLMKEADLVVLARAVKTEATKDKSPANPWEVSFQGQTTTFEVQHALKGKPAGTTVRVLHFRIPEPKPGERLVLADGPGFVTFRTEGRTARIDGAKVFLPAPDYLLFLKAMKDGRFEPVSGQIDPNQSVREVMPSTPDF